MEKQDSNSGGSNNEGMEAAPLPIVLEDNIPQASGAGVAGEQNVEAAGNNAVSVPSSGALPSANIQLNARLLRMETDSNSSSDDEMHVPLRGISVVQGSQLVEMDSDSDHDSEYFPSQPRDIDCTALGVCQSTNASRPRLTVKEPFLHTDSTALDNSSSKAEIVMLKEPKKRPHYLENCEICNKPADFVCSGCYRSSYCSEEHQKEGWTNHKRDCVHYELAHSPLLSYRGPFLIDEYMKSENGSTYRLKSKISVTVETGKQKILEEKPFLICPWPRPKMRQSPERLPPGLIVRNLACFGCGKTLCFSWIRCRDCNLFLCSKDCLYISHHKNSECKVIQQLPASKSKTLDPRLSLNMLNENEAYREFLYMDIMIIRLLLKFSEMRKSMSPEQFANEWAKLNMIWKTSTFSAGRGNERYKKLADNLQLYLGFSYKLLRGKENLLWKLFSIVDMNSFPFELPFRRFRTLCVVLSLASHSCVPNCQAYLLESEADKINIDQVESDPNEITVVLKSGRYFVEGTTLTISYVPLILGTEERRSLLLNTHFFVCKCLRCMDSTECGTFTTNVKCPTCRSAMLTPKIPATAVLKPDVFGTRKPDWECRGNILTPKSSAFRRVNRPCPPVKHEDAVNKYKSGENIVSKYSIENIASLKELFAITKNEYSYFYMSAILKLTEDIIRGTFFPLPDILADDLTEFSDQTLTGIVRAKKFYQEFMQKVNTGFDFEGFPIANLELAENELLGREAARNAVTAAAPVSRPRLRGSYIVPHLAI